MTSSVTDSKQIVDAGYQSVSSEHIKRIPLETQWKWFKVSLIVVDIVMMFTAFSLAYIVRFQMNIRLFNLWVAPSIQFYIRLMLALIPVWIVIFILKGLYSKNNLLGGTKEYSQLFDSINLGMILVITIVFLVEDFYLARAWLLVAWLFSFFFLFLGRFLMRRIVYFMRRKGLFLSPAVIVGANDEGLMLAEQLMNWKTSGFDVIGFVDKKINKGTVVYKNLKCLGNLDQLDKVLKDYGVSDIILASSAISSRDKMVDIFKKYGIESGMNVRFSSGLYEIITTGVTVNQFAYVPLLEVEPVRLTGIELFVKSLLDLVISIPGLIVISPLLAVVAVLIKIDSPGPIIHRRRVVGVNGKEFDAYKFRTMKVNGDEILAQRPDLLKELNENHKLKDDPRVTKLGYFLRKYSLDELPQLVNVIRREMSLVGPRMITQAEIEKYKQWDMNLLTVQPGITGLWQVSGRSNISYEERVRLDMYYIRNWTIWLDIQLLIQTIPAVLKGKGAY